MRYLTLALLLLVGACDTPTQVPMAPESDLHAVAAQQVFTPIGVRAWYSGGRFFQADSASFRTAIPDWPASGWLVAVVYYDVEWTPGKPYRDYYMGRDALVYDPSRSDWWQFQATDENKGQAQARLGKQISYFTATGIENEEYFAATASMIAADEW